MYYFAYGSNLNWHHMNRLCNYACEILGPAKLLDFEFGFDQRGYANIRPKAGEAVCGLVYRLKQECLDSLDAFEGYPKVFDRQRVKVLGTDGQQYEAWVYLETPDKFGGQPKREYLERVLTAAISNNLPEEWVEKLKYFLTQATDYA